MRHADVNRKFGREKGQRVALMSGLASQLIDHGKLRTSLAKAKELRPMVEKLVTRAKKDKLLGDKKLTNTWAIKFKDRKGGYTRITRLERRVSDGAQMAIIEFVE